MNLPRHYVEGKGYAHLVWQPAGLDQRAAAAAAAGVSNWRMNENKMMVNRRNPPNPFQMFQFLMEC